LERKRKKGMGANLSAEISRKIYTGTAAKILKLLGTGGVTPSAAAKACGVDISYVSQLQGEADFSLQVEEAAAIKAAAAIDIDTAYEAIEKQAVERLQTNMGFVTNTDQLMRLAKFANEAKKKVETGRMNAETGAGVAPVTLMMPTFIQNNYVVNPQNEIVGVGGREMVTLNSSSMSNLAEIHKSKRLLEVQQPAIIDMELTKHGKQKQLSAEDLNNL
jgi:hypothetical protein